MGPGFLSRWNGNQRFIVQCPYDVRSNCRDKPAWCVDQSVHFNISHTAQTVINSITYTLLVRFYTC